VRVLRARRPGRYLIGGLTTLVVVVTITATSAVPAAAVLAPFAGGVMGAPYAGIVDAPPVQVFGADLVDASTGTQLWGADLNTPRPMGSITKVMTALVVLQAGDLSQQITVSKAVIKYVEKDGASSAGLIAGDVLTARELLEAMLLPSGCDAAYLLATAYGPGRTAFIAKMNAAAAALQLTGTHFTSFDGMPYPTEYSTYSTPADLVKLGEAAMQYPLFRQIVGQDRYYLRAGHGHHAYLWYNTDPLVGSYRGMLGIKTGDTKAAGNCLLFEARRDGVTLVGVVLHAAPTSNPGSAIAAARTLLDWGFAKSVDSPAGPAG
jgi:D-alanyl-D-alanine carboxypeptidase (penicillin-binding protein 5/6)